VQSKQTGREKGANGVYNVIGEGERLLLAIPQRAGKISAAGGENISGGRGKYQQRAGKISAAGAAYQIKYYGSRFSTSIAIVAKNNIICSLLAQKSRRTM